MPSNESFIPDAIEKFLNLINGKRRSTTEIELDDATASMPGSLETYGVKNPIVSNQHVGIMEISAAQANFLTMQTRLLVAQPDSRMKAIDIGTFTGRSAMAIAKGMPAGGKVISCDTKIYTDGSDKTAEDYWRLAGVDGRIERKLGDALGTLDALLEKGEAGSFDIVFIDADKMKYEHYYEKALDLLRPGGLIILDNMLWSGYVTDISDTDTKEVAQRKRDPESVAFRELNIKIAEDQRVHPILLGFEDGVMVAQKRDPERFAKLAQMSKRNETPRLS
jgi:predicted O-methyltransferase YrrM